MSWAISVTGDHYSFVVLGSSNDVVAKTWLRYISESLISTIEVVTVLEGVSYLPGVLLITSEQHSEVQSEVSHWIFIGMVSGVLRD